MSKKQKKSKSDACVIKRVRVKFSSIIAHFFETIWAAGASVAAAMAFSTSIH